MRLLGVAIFIEATILLTSTVAAMAQSRPEQQQFDPVAVVNGINIDRDQCALLAKNDTAIWVDIHGKSACIRYYAAGLHLRPSVNPIAAIWMNGDVLGSHGNDATKHQSGFGPKEMVALEERLSHRFGIPSIYLGRPGTYGSAGKHFDMRGRPIEADLLDAALNGLKQRYNIKEIALGDTVVGVLWSRKCSHDGVIFVAQ